eukprot:286489-Amphidinium_carterae.2
MSLSWLSYGTPPYKQQVPISRLAPSFFAVSWICVANSRVGARTRMLGHALRYRSCTSIRAPMSTRKKLLGKKLTLLISSWLCVRAELGPPETPQKVEYQKDRRSWFMYTCTRVGVCSHPTMILAFRKRWGSNMQ